METDTDHEEQLKEKYHPATEPILSDLLATDTHKEPETFVGQTKAGHPITLTRGDVFVNTPEDVDEEQYLLILSVQESTGFTCYSFVRHKYRFYKSDNLVEACEADHVTILDDPWGMRSPDSPSDTATLKNELLGMYDVSDLPFIGEAPTDDMTGFTIDNSDEEIKPGDVISLYGEFRFVLNIEQDRDTYLHPVDTGIVNYNLDKNYFSFMPHTLVEKDYHNDRMTIITDPWNLRS